MFPNKRPFKRSQAAEKRRKTLIIAWGAVLFLILIATGLLAWASGRPEVTVREIFIEGSVASSEGEMRAHAERLLGGRYGGLFSRSNVFLVRSGAVEASILDSFKEIKTVSVSRESLTALRIVVTERKPYYVWCEGTLFDSSRADDADSVANGAEKECYFLDLDGYVFTSAPHFSGNAYFEFYGPLGGAVATSSPDAKPVGNYFLPGDDFERVVMFKNALRNLGLVPYAFVADGGEEYAFVLPGGGRLVFRQSQDFDVLFDNLNATLDTEPFKKRVRGGTLSSLEYIDVRFPDKVYYRFK